jgi:hypothetical protein
MRKITEEQMARIRAGDRYAMRRGLGENHKNAKLTPSAVRSIRRAYGRWDGDMRRYHRDGPTIHELAQRHGVGKNAIRSVIKRETWRHVR